MEEPPVFTYAVEPLRGRRRWRWELWDGPTLAAAGWNVTSRHAELAVRTAAAARAHEQLGLRVLRPALTRALAPQSLFVWGTEDPLVPIGFMRHVEDALPQAEHVELRCGHVPQLEAPGQLHRAIGGFLRS